MSSKEAPTKRQKIENVSLLFAATFDDLSDDILVVILSFLHTEEMNDATFVNRRVYEARKYPSLDQTRTAVIKCSPMSYVYCTASVLLDPRMGSSLCRR